MNHAPSIRPPFIGIHLVIIAINPVDRIQGWADSRHSRFFVNFFNHDFWFWAAHWRGRRARSTWFALAFSCWRTPGSRARGAFTDVTRLFAGANAGRAFRDVFLMNIVVHFWHRRTFRFEHIFTHIDELFASVSSSRKRLRTSSNTVAKATTHRECDD